MMLSETSKCFTLIFPNNLSRKWRRLGHKLSCVHITNIVTGYTHKEASFVFLDDLDTISILLDQNNNLAEEITHLHSTTNQALNILKTCTVIRGNFEQFKVCFPV